MEPIVMSASGYTVYFVLHADATESLSQTTIMEGTVSYQG